MTKRYEVPGKRFWPLPWQMNAKIQLDVNARVISFFIEIKFQLSLFHLTIKSNILKKKFFLR